MSEHIESPLDQLGRSFAAVGVLVSNIRPEQWSAPTPCAEWDVRRVVDHLVGMNRVFAAMLAGKAAPQAGEEIPNEDLPQAFQDSATTLLNAFAQPGALEGVYTSPLGAATGLDRLRIRLYDLLAHGWDLARATGQPIQLPEDAARESLAFARRQVSVEARPGRFAPPQKVSDTAPASDRLAAFLGRRIE